MPNLPHQHNKAKKAKPYANSRTEKYRLSGRALQKRNLRIKIRDSYTCRLCQCVTESGQVDHIVPLAKGGTERDSNLQYLCTQCHEHKTLIDNGCKPKARIGTDGWPINNQIR